LTSPATAGWPPVPGSRILATVAQELADSDTYFTFLAPATETGDGVLVRVTELDVARPALGHLSAAVFLSPHGDLRGLTPLDLRLLVFWPKERRTSRPSRRPTDSGRGRSGGHGSVGSGLAGHSSRRAPSTAAWSENR
jgi:hypothetical protein